MSFQILIMSLMLSLMMVMPLVMSPLMLGLFILFVALSLSAWMGVMGMSWFGMILFLVYIGGMLVMFIYFVAITPNQQYDKMIFYMLMLSGLSMFMFLLWKWKDLEKGFSMKILFNSELMMFTFNQGLIFILIFIMLFIGLIMVVKVTRLTQGPLRLFK